LPAGFAASRRIIRAMKVIGLTGNLGCGKSTVAGMLRDLGVAHIDADAVAREIRQNDGEVRAAIERRFGTLDTRELGGIVFRDARALRDLEAILHPRIRDAVRARLAELAQANVPATVVEVIKLLESPLHDACDETWVVRCEEADALRRVREARGLDEADARARLANQSPQATKVAAADVVIDGSAPLAETRQQVETALAALLRS
jgi:dephospho-CoA kinase